jgi:hypothetical protein
MKRRGWPWEKSQKDLCRLIEHGEGKKGRGWGCSSGEGTRDESSISCRFLAEHLLVGISRVLSTVYVFKKGTHFGLHRQAHYVIIKAELVELKKRY